MSTSKTYVAYDNPTNGRVNFWPNGRTLSSSNVLSFNTWCILIYIWHTLFNIVEVLVMTSSCWIFITIYFMCLVRLDCPFGYTLTTCSNSFIICTRLTCTHGVPSSTHFGTFSAHLLSSWSFAGSGSCNIVQWPVDSHVLHFKLFGNICDNAVYVHNILNNTHSWTNRLSSLAKCSFWTSHTQSLRSPFKLHIKPCMGHCMLELTMLVTFEYVSTSAFLVDTDLTSRRKPFDFCCYTWLSFVAAITDWLSNKNLGSFVTRVTSRTYLHRKWW